MEGFKSKTKHESGADQKQSLWDKTIEQLDHIADRLGKPIDAGIKETEASFMVNKFPVYGACEGHVEKRFDKNI